MKKRLSIIIAFFVVIFFYYLYTLPHDKNTKVVGIIGALSSIVILITAYQAYQEYNLNSNTQNSLMSTESWKDILQNVDDETYLKWYDNNLGGLTLKKHKLWSKITLNIENINNINRFVEKGFDFTNQEGWRSQFYYWIKDPEFQAYWSTDKESFNETTNLLVNYFTKITEEENNKLRDIERKKTMNYYS